MENNIKKIIIVSVFFLLLALPVGAVNIGESVAFNIDENYDVVGRNQINATLVKTTNNLYFYVEKSWWDSQVYAKQNEILNNLENLSQDFTNRIYPTLTSVFGSEQRPGVDNDARITILFHSMKEGDGGYFRTNDEYVKIQVPDSNAREMVYLPIDEFDNPNRLKVLLSHELVHLVTFNQKNKAFGVEDETWLNEARAEYAITIMGYNNSYDGSYLQQRVKDFLEKPTDSLTEWQDTKYDYAVADVFTQYLIDHYGINILVDSLQSGKVGIESINYALQKNNFDKNFSQIFNDWTIAVLVNNCTLGQNYCYLNENFKNLHIVPSLNFLPVSGSSSLSVTNITKNWAGNWQKVFGGNGSLKIVFNSLRGLNFNVSYVIQDKTGNISVGSLTLNNDQAGEISIVGFGTQNASVVIIPFLQTKTSGFDGNEQTFPYTFIASISSQQGAPGGSIPAGFIFKKNLGLGTISQDVVYLKIVLATEGCISGLANTTYFGSLTLVGVKCLQQKYRTQISSAAGYNIAATGFVGAGTRVELNALLTRK